jgi:hypothetical protein
MPNKTVKFILGHPLCSMKSLALQKLSREITISVSYSMKVEMI